MAQCALQQHWAPDACLLAGCSGMSCRQRLIRRHLRGPVVAPMGIDGDAQPRPELAEVRVRHYVCEHAAPPRAPGSMHASSRFSAGIVSVKRLGAMQAMLSHA